MRVKEVIRRGVLVWIALTATDVRAQDDEKKYGWFFTAELTSVVTSGNAESSTYGLSTTLRRALELSELKIDGGGIRTESALISRTAVGTPTDYQVFEDVHREKTAEAYYLRGMYNRNMTKRFTLFTGVDWLRNPFAGTESRFLVAAGAGNIWADSDRTRFKTNYSVTYTFEDVVVANPFASTEFAGIRLSYDYWRQLTGSTQVTSDLTVDWNVDTTDDVRVLFNVGLPISVSKKLAFKPSFNAQWRNMPALSEVALFDSGGTDTGQKVLVPLEELDMIFKAALVVNL